MPFVIKDATPAEIPAIVKIWLMEAEGPSPFMQLSLGTVDRDAINSLQAQRVGETLRDPLIKWLIAQDEASGETASFAQWQLSKKDAEDNQAAELSNEEKEAERESYRKTLDRSPGVNVELCVRFKEEIEDLRARAIQGRKHFLLMELGTSAAWQRKGAASKLVKWALEEADKEGVLVYLDTAIDGPGRPMYEKLGFERVDECVIELEEYGGEGIHTHIAMLRYPRESK